MRQIPTAIALGIVVALSAGCGGGAKQEEKAAATTSGPQTEEEKTLYALGAAVARNIAPFDLTEAEVKHVQQGFADGALKKKIDMDIQSYFPKIQELQQARVAKAAETEKKSGEAYLAKAAGEAGARQTPTGLVYKEEKAGTGANPAASDTVKVHYHGTLTDGTVFDSSVERKEPVSFPLSGVIPCWTEGVQMMKVGGKAKLICPSSIAYGDRGTPDGSIKPGSTLVFEVELLDIEKGAPAQ